MAAMARPHRLDRGPGTRQEHMDGSPEDLRDPIRVHGRAPGLWATGTRRPWLGRHLRPLGSAAANTNQEDAVDGGSEANKRPPMRQWLSPRDAPLPSFGSRRARFPALSGTTKALRLPIRLSAVTHWFASAAHPILPLRVRHSAPGRLEDPSRPGLWVGRPPAFPASLVWTRMGSLRSSGDPSRAFAPFHDPGRTDVPSPLTVTSMLPPLPIRQRLRHWLISGLTPAASAPRCLRFALRVATRAQGSLPAGWLAFAGRASNPLDRFERFRFV